MKAIIQRKGDYSEENLVTGGLVPCFRTGLETRPTNGFKRPRLRLRF